MKNQQTKISMQNNKTNNKAESGNKLKVTECVVNETNSE